MADLANNYTVVSGQTRGDIAYYNYYPSEVAGYYEIDTYYQFPPDFYCMDPDCQMKTELDVGLRYLERFPDTGPYWEVVRSASSMSLHSDANWLRGDAKETLIEIAKRYYELSGGRLLSINDMSLKLGGMFDLDGAYSAGGNHQSHRGGVDADINTYGGTIPCRDDDALQDAIRKVKKDGHYAELKCEDAVVNGTLEKDWRKHIDFN